MIEFRMPSLGADMEAGTLVEWLIRPGDPVKRGDVVAVVETQKGAIEIEIFEDGVLDRVLIAIGEKVPVGTPLALVRSGETPAAAIPPDARAPARREEAVPAMAPTMETARHDLKRPPSPAAFALPASSQGRPRVSPAARRLAVSRGIEIADLKGSGPCGEIHLRDVEAALAASAAAPTSRRAGLDLDAMRAAIAAAMSRSKREIPHYYLMHTCSLAEAERWLAKTNRRRAPDRRLLMTSLFVKATALAARKHVAFNGFCRDGRFARADAIHVGIAIALRGGGLAAPALHHADTLPLDELMARLRDLVKRMRAGRIRGSEMADPTITVSSLGERGVDALFGVIFPPQVAIVGFGRVARQPLVAGNRVTASAAVTLSLAADHRVSDGHAGALFLAEIAALLQEPDTL